MICHLDGELLYCAFVVCEFQNEKFPQIYSGRAGWKNFARNYIVNNDFVSALLTHSDGCLITSYILPNYLKNLNFTPLQKWHMKIKAIAIKEHKCVIVA